VDIPRHEPEVQVNAEAEREREEAGSASSRKPKGAEETNPGHEIPGTEDGVGIGAGTEPNTFEPEEDPETTKKNPDK
jgi:hypothetical protein